MSRSWIIACIPAAVASGLVGCADNSAAFDVVWSVEHVPSAGLATVADENFGRVYVAVAAPDSLEARDLESGARVWTQGREVDRELRDAPGLFVFPSGRIALVSDVLRIYEPTGALVNNPTGLAPGSNMAGAMGANGQLWLVDREGILAAVDDSGQFVREPVAVLANEPRTVDATALAVSGDNLVVAGGMAESGAFERAWIGSFDPSIGQFTHEVLIGNAGENTKATDVVVSGERIVATAEGLREYSTDLVELIAQPLSADRVEILDDGSVCASRRAGGVTCYERDGLVFRELDAGVGDGVYGLAALGDGGLLTTGEQTRRLARSAD